MKKRTLTLILLLGITILFARELFVLNSNSYTVSKIDLETFAVNNNFFSPTGGYANQICYHNDRLYIINSGDANIQIVNATTGTRQGTITLENESNPVHMIIYRDFAYVTGLFSDKLYKININNTANRYEMNIGIGPNQLIEYGGKIFVAVTGGLYGDYASGSLKVVDPETFTVIASIPMLTNAQYLTADERGYIHVVCSGDYVSIYGAVKIVDSSDYSVVQTITFNAYLTTIMQNIDGLMYVAHAFGACFYTYDPVTYTTGAFSFTNGHSILFDPQYVYVLQSPWTALSRLWIYTHDMTLVNTLTLGTAALSMCFSDDPTPESDVTLSLPEKMEIHSYPNPFSHQVKFDIKNSSTVFPLEIYNVRGQKIAEKSSLNATWDGKDTSGQIVPNGVYFVRASNGQQYIVKKIVKMK